MRSARRPRFRDSPWGSHQDKELSVLEFNPARHFLNTYYVRDASF